MNRILVALLILAAGSHCFAQENDDQSPPQIDVEDPNAYDPGYQNKPSYPWQQQGPFIQGYNPGSPTGFQTLPAVINSPQAQGPFITAGGAQTLPAMVSSPRRTIMPFSGRPVPGGYQPRGYQQPQPFDGYGSLLRDATGVQEISPAPAPAPINSWTPYSNPSIGWNTFPSTGPWMQPQPVMTSSPWSPSTSSSPTTSDPTAVTSGWVRGSPSWRRSYTPLPGQMGCYNRCRPNCGFQYPLGYGCRPSCRAACNIRPNCGVKPPYWAGNTMVCGNNGGWGGWGNWPYAPFQPAMGNSPMTMSASAPVATSGDLEQNNNDDEG